MLKLNIKLEGRNRDYGRAVISVNGFTMNEKEFDILTSIFTSLADSTDIETYKLSEYTFEDTSPTDEQNAYAVIVIRNKKYIVKLYFFPSVMKDVERIIVRFVLRKEYDDPLFVLLRLLELVEGLKVIKEGEWELFFSRS